LRGGDWATGYHRYDGDWYVFANVGLPGRTGHDYENRWIGDDLLWRGKTNSRIGHETIQSMLSDQSHIHVFTRTDDRAPFTYEGVATAMNPQATVPVTITWRFNSAEDPSANVQPGEVVGADQFVEGAVRTVVVNRYERDRGARRACIAHWSISCVVCGFSFVERYGAIGADYIHVHHLTPLAAVGAEYTLDPITDLRPVCPNCHVMIHRTDPPMGIENLRNRLAERATDEVRSGVDS
jgi:5-methylcytosine-specific restriction protein A